MKYISKMFGFKTSMEEMTWVTLV